MENTNNERKKICQQCSATFSCYTENCWCNELPPVMPFSENADCLCPDCLKKEIDLKIQWQLSQKDSNG